MSSKPKNKKHYAATDAIHYGPIRICHRRSQASTLLTGRRSKFEQVSDEEQLKRNLRRERNRLSAKKLKERREKVLNDLLEQVKQLEEKEVSVENLINQLELHKQNLILQLTKFNQDEFSYFEEQFSIDDNLFADIIIDDLTSFDCVIF
ncbi:hypothetical protein I4U23_027656 [Adineta vaga]|nr:hypothetical protein I4U23_027656 [Adineta vaga]